MKITRLILFLTAAIGIIGNILQGWFINIYTPIAAIANISVFLICIFCSMRLFKLYQKHIKESHAIPEIVQVDYYFQALVKALHHAVTLLKAIAGVFTAFSGNEIDQMEKKISRLTKEEFAHDRHEKMEEILLELDKETEKYLSSMNSSIVEAIFTFVETYNKLPFIQRLLDKVIEKTEDAAFVLIEKIGNISKLQSEAVEEAQQGETVMKTGNTQADFAELIKNAQNASEKNRSILSEIVSFNSDNMKNVKDIESLIKKINSVLSSIIDISERNKVITLNLAIEAAKVGSKASSFKIISQQIHQLNNDMGRFIREINDTVEKLKQYNDEILKNWVEKNQHLIVSVEENMKKVSQQEEIFMERIQGTHQMTTKLFHKLSNTTVEVKKNLDRTMHALQFQDITRQQIQNVEHFLKDIENDIKNRSGFFALFGYDITQEDIEIQNKIKKDFKKVLKVSDEHEVIV